MKAKVIAIVALALHIIAYNTARFGLVYLPTLTGEESTYFDHFSALAFVGYFWAWKSYANETFWRLFTQLALGLAIGNCADEWFFGPCTYSWWEIAFCFIAILFTLNEYRLIRSKKWSDKP